MSIDFNGTKPIYMQIMDLMKRDIATKTFKEGEKLPSVREMSEKLKVNPNTMQRAYQELEREGYTFTQRGMGTFVTNDEEKIVTLKKEIAKDVIEGFIDGMRSIGFSKTQMLSILSEYLKGEEE